MSGHDEIIRRIAALVGVADRYRDQEGKTIETPLESKRAALAGLGLEIESEAEARDTLGRVEALKNGLVPALIPAESGRQFTVPVRGVTSGSVVWRLQEEGGATREGRAKVTNGAEGATIMLAPLPLGYHRLQVQAEGRTAQATIIAAPRRCWEPRAMREGGRLWGTTTQIYSLRSARNQGIGDYTDVADLAAGTGEFGASFLGLSPVHALFSADRTKISPYSPSSRLFLETIFINPVAVAGFSESRAARLLDDSGMQERLAALRDAPLVDHAAVWDLKRSLLDALWEDFQNGGDHAAFETFRRKGGEALQAHATFEALSEHFRREERWWLGDWPEPYRNARSREVRAFERDSADLVAFHAWLQWLADLQLGEASDRARSAGMNIGLYRDLAVGADAGGSEIWSNPERFAPGLSIGSPPDPFGPTGQNWGLPPFNPLTLEEQGLAAFRALVASNMRHAGAIRIDHAFQIQRLFLIPSGMSAAQGAYVSYPFEAMLAVLRLESNRARSVVIAEDLGTGPEGFSDAIMASGILSYRVLWFEREDGGAFKRPESYPRSALAVFTTHDLPTFRGWWRGLDTDLRQTLGVYDNDTAERERGGRRNDLRLFHEALSERGLLHGHEAPEEPPLEPMMRYLARTPSSLVGLQIEDASGELNQANLPGQDQSHPNWKRRLGTDLDAIIAPGSELAKLAAALAEEGRGIQPRTSTLASPPPRATYRLQFHKDFTFDDAVRIVPYLAKLGISHVYSSPIHTARPGSVHGYDIVDHSRINPELGGEEGFRRLTDALKEHGLGLVLDIVPNHMGVGGADNAWWLSVLEWGELSPFGRAFDIDWERLGANHKLIVPFLGDRYGEALEKGDLKLTYDAEEGSFSVWHWEHRFPVCPLTYPIILDRALAALPAGPSGGSAEMLAISERLRTMNDETIPERRAAFPEECETLKGRLAQAVAGTPELQQAIDHAVTFINGSVGLPESFGTLHRILEAQAYRLAHWRVAASDINYRRFFDINALAGLRVEDTDVFERSHAMVFRLVREGLIQGLRIDHVDGLADPEGYLRALQAAVGPGFYIVIEKILEPGEPLRPWPVAGTTGYDVLNLLDGVFVDSTAAEKMEQLYRSMSGLEGRYGALLREAKVEVLETSFASELEVLTSDLKRLADSDRRTRDYTVYALRRALSEIIARFPVYRTYLGEAEAVPEDRALLEETIEASKRHSVLPDRTVHDFIAASLLTDHADAPAVGPDTELVRRFRRRFQQLTGPVMAKSLEDTFFYRYVRLLSLNEVGGDPHHFGVPAEEFHRINQDRARSWPHAMIATATHDTKRGEDARARLNVLSEVPDLWAEALRRWQETVFSHAKGDGEARPDANDQYLILQAILGAWPVELLDEGAEANAVAAFRERIEGFVTKALREAKRHTSWVHVNEAYEAATLGLVRELLDPEASFLSDFRPLARRLAFSGMLAGLARTILKVTLPGVPDIYQGTEMWDLSLVDPDNRRPVDYDLRTAALDANAPAASLMPHWQDGRIKQRVLAALLADRAECPGLYASSDYQVVRPHGSLSRNVLAFTRTSGEERLLVIVPRLVTRLIQDETPPLGAEVWGDTSVQVPPGSWRNIITGEITEIGQNTTRISELFTDLPFSVLRAQS
ncbi:malto-oligosyltrehalose synthase [Microvirga lenta]|uniref:malto-oligosyltrehalose synthase n=1 Tax=Microvirga lenta TaxID=2881337 RepID=UPI001CFF87F7|nr:malto-oligosyltrehalose synthase [Microvirga lenta]MCB5177368.1 malto-oligosyltrehalose synthase [Microvirga lenta]